MLATELLTQLLELQRDDPDFSKFEVYLDVVSRESYAADQAWQAAGAIGEFVDEYIAEGEVLDIIVPTAFDLTGPTPVEIGRYIVIRGLELEDESAPNAQEA